MESAVQENDSGYLTARTNFLRELNLFHQSRGSSVKSLGTTEINGVEVDLYLLFQIVSSHGGSEKVNWRNEWDSLLRHFRLPRATNGGLAIKGIYNKNLELYEKIHILGEDVDVRDEGEEDFEDFRHRRRYAAKVTNSPSLAAPANPVPHYASSSLIPENVRIQHGLSIDLASVEYEKLILTLQSPLPNEQDMAISVCTLLSNDTKHVLVLTKAPQLLNLLLAHAGIYNHCGLRQLMEETYVNARGLSHAVFWKNSLPFEIQELLCERFVMRRTKYFDLIECRSKQTRCNSPIPPAEKEEAPVDGETTDLREECISQDSTVLLSEPRQETDEMICCSSCPCSEGFTSEFEENLPFLVRGGQPDPQIGDRINQISTILRNLSFEDYNAEVMASNPTFLRYLLVSMNCENSFLSGSSWDILGNMARFMRLNDPMQDPISAMIFSLVTDGLYSVDRFRILHSLETIREWVKFESNEAVLIRYFEKKIYNRICQLLTISDIMLLIYTLECILSITTLGDVVCNEIVQVQGSVAALVSLVTVEAQSYGPKGCILMRVVETVTGNPQHSLAFQAAKKQLLKQTDQATNQGTGCPPQQIQLTTISQGQTSQILVSANTPHPPQTQTPPPEPTPTRTPPTTVKAVNHPQSHNSLLGSSIIPVQNSTISSPMPVQVTNKWTPAKTNATGLNNSSHTALQLTSPTVLQNTGSSVSMQIPTPALSPSLSFSPAPAPLPIPSATPVKSKARAQSKKAAANSLPPNIHLTNKINAVLVTSSIGTTLHTFVTSTKSAQVAPTQTVSALTPLTSTISLITSRGTLSEDGWAMAWLKGSFDVAVGTSIEQGEIYRMYCAARKNPNVVLSMDQFVHCVKCAYGASVGPVIKQFGSSSLSFLEGIRPKMTVQNVNSGNMVAAVSNSVTINSGYVPVVSPTAPMTTSVSGSLTFSPAISASPGLLGTHEPSSAVGVNIPSTEKKTLSPILKATLSQPPKPKLPAGSKKQKKSTSKCSSKKVGESVKKAGASIVSPTSSAIRSLLASKVTQRQQKKLQPAEKKTYSKGGPKEVKKGGKKKCGKSNGIDGALVPEETSASSSLNSTASSDSVNPPRLISFHGVLHNGLSSEDSSKDSDLVLREELDDIKNQNRLKGMLVDLLEKKVKPREPINGAVANREIRISDKGLELVDKMMDTEANSNSSTSNASMLNAALPPMGNDTLSSVFNAVIEGSDSSSQQMTFYSSSESQVTFQGRISHLKNHSSSSGDGTNKVVYVANETVLMSGGGSGSNAISGDANNGNDSSCCSSGGGNFENNNSGGSKVLDNDTLDSGDLIDKFNEISDLIMVPPEQLGIKRTYSTDDSSSDNQPPFKKSNLSNGTKSAAPSPNPAPGDTQAVGVTTTTASVYPVLQATMNKSGIISSVKSILSVVASTPNHVATVTSDVNSIKAMPSLNNIAVNPMVVSTPSATTLSLPMPPNANIVTTAMTNTNPGGMVQVPLRFSMNSSTPNQLTFRRQLVIPPGQQFLWKTGNTQTAIQGQVILSKPSNSSNDPNQIPKAIIILQQPHRKPNSPGGDINPQQHVQLHYQTTSGASGTAVCVPPISTTFATNISKSTTVTNVTNVNVSTVATSVIQSATTFAHKTNSGSSTPYLNQPIIDLETIAPYVCEWSGCGVRFGRFQEVYYHAARTHCPESLTEAVRCEWGVNRCDPTLRKRLSLMTHLQDRHCSKPALELAIFRRKSKIDYQPPPAQPTQHPGYAPNAAFHAIKRHAVQYTNPKELLDDNEGPVTKSIRLTAALILKNLCNYSAGGRRLLREHESNLAGIAMSNVESSRTISQLLYDMSKRS